ncbi:MAG: hypothetical protein ACRBBR_14785 [Cellvibrionaceae bacterium]
MIGYGERLYRMIEEKHTSVASCAIMMRQKGYDINEQTLYRIIGNKNKNLPNQDVIDIICEYFEVEPECFLYGQCLVSRKHGYLSDSLSPRMQKLAMALTDSVITTLADKSNELDIR